MVGEALGVIFVIALVLLVFGGASVGIAAFVMGLKRRRRLRSLGEQIERMEKRIARLEEALEAAPPPPETAPQETAEPEEIPLVPVSGEEVPSEEAKLPVFEDESPAVKLDWAQFEQVIGKRWLTWVGVVALLAAGGFFVKYAFEHDWISPSARVLMGILAGLVLLVAGDRFVRRRMRALGQGLLGGGLALLYLSLFAAFSLYELVPQAPAFAGMVLVTAAGMTLAVLHDALPISFLAVLGGFLTPVILSTGENARDVLFTYLLVLDLGVLGMALFKQWRALDALAFACTAGLFAAWFHEFYAPAAMLPTLGWLGAFYVVFLLLPFVNPLRHGTEVKLERFSLAIANAGLAFACAYVILHEQHQQALGFIALGMAGCYTVLAGQARRRIPSDARALFGFVALAAFFLTLAVPLHLKMHGITLAWAVEGPVLLYLGYRYRYLPVRIGSAAVVVLALVRLFAAHWPLHDGLFVLFWTPSFGSAICIPLAAGAMAVIHQWHLGRGEKVDRVLKVAAALGGGYLALIFVQHELALWFRYNEAAYMGAAAGAGLWAVGAAAFLGGGLRWRCSAARIAGVVAAGWGYLLALAAYGQDAPGSYLLFLNARLLAGLAVILALFAHVYMVRRFRDLCAEAERTLARLLLWVGLAGLLCLLSVEAYVFCQETLREVENARWTGLMSISIVWAVYAVALLSVGFWRRFRALRFAGLGLFGATALKIVLVDIAEVKQIYRIVSFLVVGLLMIGGAYLYHRIEKCLIPEPGEQT